MRFAVSYGSTAYGVDPDHLVRFARHAEELGFEGIYLPEHVALAPGMTFGEYEMPVDLPYADPIVCLTFVAAATSRLLLGTGVLLLPYHHPVTLAKRLATLDLLAKGRLRLLTVGVGAFPQEADATGVSFRTRGRRADEALEVLNLLWTRDEVSYDGEFYRLDRVTSRPHPAGGALPVHVGGSSMAAARRAAKYGAGWFAGGMLGPADRIAQLAAARSSGRPIEYTRWGAISLTPESAAGFARQGVDRLVVSPSGATWAEQRDELSAFADRHGLPG
ncbi:MULTISPECIES: TIGR03619 family F420-dependent LLM class oxidoreductase [Catenuloplanes]|uniref:F420-dependent oxidoreductase n=1 Tax=Catenuloplanes niger TaxID=587534 RepID=A0AAE3ZVD3_9ACTN|nr:TIGR03619 family F420-dependent LLM class oxidoreductase [Catenuloplanes niger]MDR7326476.1 putative F420-dependent oxidoreductase [Catenuloplanes niger]